MAFWLFCDGSVICGGVACYIWFKLYYWCIIMIPEYAGWLDEAARVDDSSRSTAGWSITASRRNSEHFTSFLLKQRHWGGYLYVIWQYLGYLGTIAVMAPTGLAEIWTLNIILKKWGFLTLSANTQPGHHNHDQYVYNYRVWNSALQAPIVFLKKHASDYRYSRMKKWTWPKKAETTASY